MKRKIQTFSFICFFLTSILYAQHREWVPLKNTNRIGAVSFETLDKNNYSLFELDIEHFKSKLVNAPLRRTSNWQSNVIISFPDIKGKLQQFRVVETSIFSSEDNAVQHKNIKTYLASRMDDSGTRARFSVTPLGLNAMISEPGKEPFFIQPATKIANGQYLVYNKSARQNSGDVFECLTEDDHIPSRITDSTALYRDANDQVLRTFRIAISVTQEYTAFWDDGNDANGIDREDALAQLISTLNRSNEVFEVDMAVTFLLVDTLDDPAIDLIYSPTFPDPYGANLNGDLQTNLTATVGESDYDIGHLFDFGTTNGNAGCIGCVCSNGKGSGFSSHDFLDNDGGPYMSDFFDIDYVPHEIGHQMGANHTYSHFSEGTGVNAEPGSGTTIMGYAGITGINDVQDHSDPYFHYYSITQILNNITSAPANCAVTTNITNNPPVANAGLDYTIPQGTAFVLRGSATDPNTGDVLTYCWEQIDNGVTTSNNFGPNKTTGAVWRSRPPSTSPDRYMPIFERVLNGELTESNPLESVDNTTWETVSTTSRDLNFALTVRDRSEAGGVGQTPQSDFDEMIVTVDATSGPFVVTSQTSNVTWDAGSTQTVTWDVANTNTGTVNTPTVNILLSVDGGQTFPFVLASDVPNDGSQDVTVPIAGSDTSMARLIVEGHNNIFYAVNSSDFTIQESEFVITVTDTELDVCQPNSAVYNFTYNTFLGFSDTTTFSVSGLPSGTSATINPISASADGTNGTVTIDGIGSLAVGSYMFTFDGVSGGTSQTIDLMMNVYNDTFGSTTLVQPLDNATDLGSEVDLTWNGSDNAQDYLVEISTQANFSSIFDSATVQVTSYTVDNLEANTTYYWRVTASNSCGVANPSSVFSFTTANIICNSYDANDLPIAILETANAVDNYTSVINVPTNEAISDINVTINIQHTWNNDLDIFLISPAGTIVELSTDNGNDDDDNYTNTVFDQEASTAITSGTSPFTGTFIPEGDLSVLYGEMSGGNWTLSVDDDLGFVDGGQILGFTIELCTQSTLSVDAVEQNDSAFYIYPNPNKGVFNLVFNDLVPERAKVSVFDVRGREILKEVIDHTVLTHTIHLEGVQAGVYLVNVDDGFRTVTKRIVID